MVDSFEHFKNYKRLSLRDGKFSLFEYIEENPLIVNNIGMGSRVTRYVYHQRVHNKLSKKKERKAKEKAALTENVDEK